VQVFATAAIAGLAEGVLLHQAGVERQLVAAAGLTLATVGTLTSFGVRRLQSLAARLVAEEVHRGLATERGLHLEKANEQVALINSELEEQHQRLVIAQREAEMLASLLVHDMKQPLTSVLALLELSAAEVAGLGGGEPLQRDLEMAREQAERLLAMIGDLLAISRLEKGQLEPRPEQLQIGALLREVAQRVPRGKARVFVAAPDDLVFPLDRELTERMVENLLSNALSFAGPSGTIELSASQSGGELVLAVKNDGPPVPIERRATLFEKLAPSGVHRHNAGLGLYFCRLVAEAHRGRIALEHDARFPVSFVARLPALQAKERPVWAAIA
jgi:signal transduction histidine kinase